MLRQTMGKKFPCLSCTSIFSGDLPERYRLCLLAVWRLRFFVAKRTFARARRRGDLDLPKLELAKVCNEVQSCREWPVDDHGLSLLSREQQQLCLVQRLALVEQKMAELDRKADLILQMATQLGDRVIEMRRVRNTLRLL